MRIALVTDWLTEPGGAEKVLLELHRMYPDAPIYTSQYRKKRIDWFNDAKVKTGWLNLLPVRARKIIGPLRQSYFSHLDLSAYDLVISVTGAEAKSIRLRPRRYDSKDSSHREVLLPALPQPVHLCYCHTPTQYYWGKYRDYIKDPGFGKLNPIVRFFFRLFAQPLRHADYKSARRPDQFITISRYTASEIEKFYHREAIVVAPPVDFHKFSTPSAAFSTKEETLSTKAEKFSTQKGNFSTDSTQFSTLNKSFVIACRQVTWKKVDLAILACLKTGQPLMVIGDGPEHEHLVSLAGGSPLITFVPWLTSDQLAFYLQNCRGFLFPSEEPFGIAPVEALAAGCPVIAYNRGGSQDFIRSGQNGLFFSEQTAESLAAAIINFEKCHFNRAKVCASAEIFDISHFRSDITAIVEHFSAAFETPSVSVSLAEAQPARRPPKTAKKTTKKTTKKTNKREHYE